MEIEKLNKLTSELIKSYHLIPSIPSIIQECNQFLIISNYFL